MKRVWWFNRKGPRFQFAQGPLKPLGGPAYREILIQSKTTPRLQMTGAPKYLNL